MDKIARIRQEIERRKGYISVTHFAEELLSFLDTLEAEERPEPYIPVYDEEYLKEKQRLFKEHHGEVDVDKMLTECRGYDEENKQPDKSLEEAANKFAVFYDQGTCDGIAQDCFIAGAEWQKEQDNYDAIFHKGMMYYRKQMHEDAVEAIVLSSYNSMNKEKGTVYRSLHIAYQEEGKPCFRAFDKVRIVVLKEEEEK